MTDLAKLIEDLKCKIGLHSWSQDRKLRVIDMWPMDSNYQTPKRQCARCHQEQQWLPGYGGSEIGCWIKSRHPEGQGGRRWLK